MKGMARLPGIVQPAHGPQWHQGTGGYSGRLRKKREHYQDEEEPDLCHSTKRFLSEETMATCFQLQQLGLATCNTARPSMPINGQLNIQTVASSSGDSSSQQVYQRSEHTDSIHYHPQETGSKQLTDSYLPREQRVLPVELEELETSGSTDDSSSDDEHFHSNNNAMWRSYSVHNTFSCLTSPCHVPAIPTLPTPCPAFPSHVPATPVFPTTLNLSDRDNGGSAYQARSKSLTSSHLSGVDIDPSHTTRERVGPGTVSIPSQTAVSSSKKRWRKWEVILEDVSSDSSDGLGSPERPLSLWLAPEICSGLASAHRDTLLPPAIMKRISKKPNMELVPWVGPEKGILPSLKASEPHQNNGNPSLSARNDLELESEDEQPGSGDGAWDYEESEMEVT